MVKREQHFDFPKYEKIRILKKEEKHLCFGKFIRICLVSVSILRVNFPSIESFVIPHPFLAPM